MKGSRNISLCPDLARRAKTTENSLGSKSEQVCVSSLQNVTSKACYYELNVF